MSYTDCIWLLGKGSKGGVGSQLRQWSSIIGIVTAIIGNVLISLALNIQRYAHLRIDRQYNKTKDSSPPRRKQSPNGTRNYGTSQSEGANGKQPETSEPSQDPFRNRHSSSYSPDAEEEDESRPLHRSFDSDTTLKRHEKDEDSDESRPSYLRSPYWWVGIVLMTVGEAGNFLAYGFAPASIVSPLGVVALISNCVIAPFLLKERFRLRDLAGVLVAIGGAVTVVLSAKQREKKLGPNELWETIKRWEFLLYVIITTVAIIVLMFLSPKYGTKTILVNLGLVGLYGGYTALSTKGVASLLSVSYFDAFTYPIFYPLLLILIASAVMQIRYLNRALQTFNATQVIPTQFVLFTLSVIIGSAVLYRDFEATTADRVVKFVCGCLLTFFGVYLITSKREPRDNEGYDEDEEEGGEESIRLIDEEANYEENMESSQTQPQQMKGRESETPFTPTHSSSRQPSSLLATSAPSNEEHEDPDRSTTSVPVPQNDPWASSSEAALGQSPSPSPGMDAASDVYVTPQGSRAQTPYFTPSTAFQQRLRPPPTGLSRTISSPADPETPTKRPKLAGRATSPPKPDPLVKAAAQTPTTTPVGYSLARSARGSIGRLLVPAPLMNPLSGSLSALVADSLRRGEGTPHSLRRGKSHRTQRSHHGITGVPTLGPSFEDVSTPDGLRRRSVQLDQSLEPSSSRREGERPTLSVARGRLRAMSDGVGVLLDRFKIGTKPDLKDDVAEGTSRDSQRPSG